VTLDVPTGISAGDHGPHLNTTSAIEATVDGSPVTGTGEGLGFRASGFYDGIGDSAFEAYGGKLKLVVPIQ
jgi:hypothetical protein